MLKLTNSWLDKRFNITNEEYLTPKGLKVLVAVNPTSVDYNFSVAVRGGSYYESQLGVPDGTAHFLEHILFGNPNKRFKTREELDRFTYGNKEHPSFYSNATTTIQYLYFYAHGNYKAANRIMEFIYSKLDYPLERIDEYVDKERAVIRGELHRLPKDERNESLQSRKFSFGEIYPEFAKVVIGSEMSLDEINADYLRKYYSEIFKIENAVVTIQTPKKLTKAQIGQILKFENCFVTSKLKLVKNIKKIKPEFKYSHFQEPNTRGVFFSISYYRQVDNKINYELNCLNYILTNLFHKLGNEYLREEKKLIYGVDVYNVDVLFNYKVQGFKLHCEFDLFKDVLEETYNMIFKYLNKFLDSEHGKVWFESLISNYIFPRTLPFNIAYAEGLGISILDNFEVGYDLDKAIATAKKITLSQFKKYVKDRLKEPPLFWLVSPFTDKEIYKVFKKSSFYRKF